MGNRLRLTLAGNGNLLRLALVVLALYSVLPAQLVWCHEEGRAPRMEAGFNGQCLAPAAALHIEQAAGAARAPSKTSAEHAIDSPHDCCIGCFDQPAHHQQAAQSAGAQDALPRPPSGGWLFSLALAECDCAAADAPAWLNLTQHRAPRLTLLHARATCLLI